jgi:hypothetical protein
MMTRRKLLLAAGVSALVWRIYGENDQEIEEDP